MDFHQERDVKRYRVLRDYLPLGIPAALAPHQALLRLPISPVHCVLELDAVDRLYFQCGIQTKSRQSEARFTSSKLPVKEDCGVVHGRGLNLACVTCPVIENDC